MSKILLGGTFIVFAGLITAAYISLPQNTQQAPATTTTGSQTTSDSGATVTTVANDTDDDISDDSDDAAAVAQTQTTTKTTTTPAKTTGTTATASGYTMAKVATHNTASSCWAVVNGNVYDLTKWINQHPGGPGPIVSMCGTDGSDAFNGQHGGQRRPASELAGYLLGPLSN